MRCDSCCIVCNKETTVLCFRNMMVNVVRHLILQRTNNISLYLKACSHLMSAFVSLSRCKCICICITIDAMLNFDVDVDANADVGCEKSIT